MVAPDLQTLELGSTASEIYADTQLHNYLFDYLCFGLS